MRLPALYHLTELSVRPGHLVAPGRYGSTVATWYAKHGKPHKHYRRELIFETVRLNEFPHLPSRLRSAYAFVDRRLAEQWFSEAFGDRLYEVVATLGAIHFADIAWTSTEMNGDWTDTRLTLDNARRYWRGERDPHDHAFDGRELLASDGLVLGRRLR